MACQFFTYPTKMIHHYCYLRNQLCFAKYKYTWKKLKRTIYVDICKVDSFNYFQMMENDKKRWSIPKKLCPNAKKKRFNGVTTTIELFKTFLCKVEIEQKRSSSPKELCYNAKMNIVQVFPKTVN